MFFSFFEEVKYDMPLVSAEALKNYQSKKQTQLLKPLALAQSNENNLTTGTASVRGHP